VVAGAYVAWLRAQGDRHDYTEEALTHMRGLGVLRRAE